MKLKVRGQIIDSMVGTGAETSVVTELVGPFSIKATAIEGAIRENLIRPYCLPQKCQMGGRVTHEFLYIPECPVPLLGRDLSKLGAQVTSSPQERPTLQVGSTTYLLSLLVTPQDEWKLHDPLEGNPDGLGSQGRELIR